VDSLPPDNTMTVYDPTFYGIEDARRRVVRTTHPDSFRDDPLRILRALRFVARGFELSTDAGEQMEAHADAVTGLTDKGVSGTVYEELCKILMGRNVADALRIAANLGVIEHWLPELAAMIGFDQGSRYHDLTTDEHTFKALDVAAAVDAPLRVRLALLFHDAGKPASAWIGRDGRKHYYANDEDGETRDHEDVGEELWRAAAKRLNVPARVREDVATLIRAHMFKPRAKWSKVARARVKYGDDLLRDLHMHKMCDIAGKRSTRLTEMTLTVADMEDMRRKMVAAGVPASTKGLKITGYDAQQVGLEGRDIGVALNAVLDEVICQWDGRQDDRDWQLARLEALCSSR
jgi:tRNA nucleotidyltransferase/poly(A) polymerase